MLQHKMRATVSHFWSVIYGCAGTQQRTSICLPELNFGRDDKPKPHLLQYWINESKMYWHDWKYTNKKRMLYTGYYLPVYRVVGLVSATKTWDMSEEAAKQHERRNNHFCIRCGPKCKWTDLICEVQVNQSRHVICLITSQTLKIQHASWIVFVAYKISYSEFKAYYFHKYELENRFFELQKYLHA